MAVDRWNQRFAGEGYYFGTEPNAFLVSQRDRFRAGQRALAVADGEGRNGVWLAKLGLEVLSVDFSPIALAKARKLAAAEGVSLATEEADLRSWDWGAARFDVVVAIFIQFATPTERAAIFAGMKAALKLGGLLLLQGYGVRQLEYRTGGPSQIEHLYSADLLRSAFADMKILHLAEHDAEIHEGSGHNGLSALVDLVAQK